jgi:hypothetical protein
MEDIASTHKDIVSTHKDIASTHYLTTGHAAVTVTHNLYKRGLGEQNKS